VNLYGFVGNDGVNGWDLLGLAEKPGYGTNLGISIPNGNAGANFHFADVANAGADEGGYTSANSGKEILDFLEKSMESACCIYRLTIAGHGWDSWNEETQTVRPEGPGLPGVGSGTGFYSDGSRWATDPSSRTISDLKALVEKNSAGAVRFCKGCEIRLHACNVASSFAEALGRVIKCKVVYAQGSCAGLNPWTSGVGDESGTNDQSNGFWETEGGNPSTPNGNTFTP
jgi:hypothetical protein